MRTLEHFRQCVDASKSCTGMDEKVRLYAEGKKEQGMGVYDYHHDSGKSDRPEMPALYEKRPEMTEENPYKAYVEVQADFSADEGGRCRNPVPVYGLRKSDFAVL